MTQDAYASLRQLFVEAGYAASKPALLHPSKVFLDLIGEDIRGRMFLTMDASGEEFCLRPDYTIPVCSTHLAGADPTAAARYSYCGPVFRHREDEPDEFVQAGVECLGRTDLEQADADMLALSLQATAHLGVRDPEIHIGDEGLFRALLDALDCPPVWKRRLGDLFGDRERLDGALSIMSGETHAAGSRRAGTALAEVLDSVDPGRAQDAVADLLKLTGLRPVAGRSATEIAERLLEQATLAHHDAATSAAAKVVNAYLAIAGTPREAIRAISEFAAKTGLDLSAAIRRFEIRLDKLEAHGLDVSAMRFAADFGRRLDYYTGFVFEVYAPSHAEGKRIVGGGRYDRLLGLMGAETHIPATGFSVWLDRI